MKGSHKMAIEKVLATIKGRKVKKGKKWGVGGWGEGKHIMATKRFFITTCTW
jgi:hypothetical protein